MDKSRTVLNKGELSGENIFRLARLTFGRKIIRLARRTLGRKTLRLARRSFGRKSFASYGEVSQGETS